MCFTTNVKTKEKTYIVVECLALCRRHNVTRANDKVAETLTVVAFGGVALDDRLHDLENRLFVDVGSVQLVEPLTMVASTEV